MQDWRTARSLLVLRNQYNTLYPGRNKASDGTIGDAAHRAVASDHNPDASGVVKALDITHDPEHGLDIGVEAQRLLESRDPRIKYVIANSRIFEPALTGWSWRRYSGTSDPHTNHMHISVNGGNADDESIWNINSLGEQDMVDENFLTAFWLDLFDTPPTAEQKRQYIGKDWRIVYDELRNSGPAKARRDYVKRQEEMNRALAQGVRDLQQRVATGDTKKIIEDLQATINKYKVES